MTHTPPTNPVEAEPATQSSSAQFICSLLLCILDCLLMLGSGGFIVFTVPKFQAIFAELDVELPQITVMLLSVPSMIWMVILLFGAILLAIKEILISNKNITLNINGIMFLLLLGWIAILTLAIWKPFNTGIQSVT
jgi:type II secretory pathway component PulF